MYQTLIEVYSIQIEDLKNKFNTVFSQSGRRLKFKFVYCLFYEYV